MPTNSTQLLAAETGTTSAPTLGTDGQNTNDLNNGRGVPDVASIIVEGTVTGAGTVDLDLYVYDDDSSTWSNLGAISGAQITGTTTISYRGALYNIGHYDRVDCVVTAITGTAATVSVWIRAEDITD